MRKAGTAMSELVSVEKAARLLGDADIVFAIPMSVSSKNPFFDRKSPAAKNTENAETKK